MKHEIYAAACGSPFVLVFYRLCGGGGGHGPTGSATVDQDQLDKIL